MKRQSSIESFVSMQSSISRRDLFDFMKAGKVLVNGVLVTNMGTLVNETTDKIQVNGERILRTHKAYYYKYFKPKGMLTTMSDPKGRSCVGDVIRSLKLPLVPVGRLDRHTTGLLVLTNDGHFSQLLMHPSKKIMKQYHLTLDKVLTKNDLNRLLQGVFLEDGPFCFSSVTSLSETEFLVELHEGRNRIIRRAFALVGYDVVHLKRKQLGVIDLKGLKVGDVKPLSKREIMTYRG